MISLVYQIGKAMQDRSDDNNIERYHEFAATALEEGDISNYHLANSLGLSSTSTTPFTLSPVRSQAWDDGRPPSLVSRAIGEGVDLIACITLPLHYCCLGLAPTLLPSWLG